MKGNKRNVKTVFIETTEVGKRRFSKTPAYNRLLSKDQIIDLYEGCIEFSVNHYQFSALVRMAGACPNDIKITDCDELIKQLDSEIKNNIK